MAAAFVFVVVVVCTTTTDALTPNSSSSSSASSSASSSHYSMLSSSASKKASSSSSSNPFGINRFTLHESTNGINGGGGMNGDDTNGSSGMNGGGDHTTNNNNKEIDLKSKSDSDVVNGIHYPFPSPPPQPVAETDTTESSVSVTETETSSSPEDDDQYSAFSYFTDTSSSSTSTSTSTSTPPADEKENTAAPSNFLSVDGNGSGGLMGRSEGTGGTDATLMMGDTAKNKATPVDSGSVHLPTTQDVLKKSSLTEVSGNSVVRGPIAERPMLTTNASDEPIRRPTVPQNDDTATSLHVSNIVFAGPTTAATKTTTAPVTTVPVDEAVENVIPTILKRYVPPPKEDQESPSSLPASSSSSSSSLKGTSTGGANHFASPEPPKIKVRRFVPGQDDGIFKHPEPKNDNQSEHMLPVQKKKLKPYTKPVTKPVTKIALPQGAVAVSTTTTSASALAYNKPTPTTLSDESATTNPKSTKLVRIVSEETTSTIPHDDPKDRYSNEFQGPTSATLHQKTGLQVNTPVSLWQPRDKFLDH
eukprot:CAMPEP_0113461292 /NCGR_PEP_ID=MMETSP0014_2-20120614/11461_1 /TAXON_ID=2857 /ORGANISM="Nitzschia sp." /LENGTH=531 /DNA_ID=CAMNT_0000353039 /DNA_START=156 /DNA_END=1751 /DNA_ORIENTATION=- /assembly_acc=CAM_ASM_000159